jgi:hypothetical protein
MGRRRFNVIMTLYTLLSDTQRKDAAPELGKLREGTS